MSVIDKFLKYVSFDTQSDENSDCVPSTSKQLILGKELIEECEKMNADHVYMDSSGIVYVTIHATCDNKPSIGFLAHMDTATEISGKDVKPQIIKNYQGQTIFLNDEYKMNPEEFKNLKKVIGDDLIVTDGTTLLGGDDKAGVAILMQVMEDIIQNPVEHGKLMFAFTCDEEVGKGTDHFDLDRFNVDFAYTIDGADIDQVDYETFNAAHAKISIHGTSIHPGEAKGRMVNASLLASEFMMNMPSIETPQCTENYEGFYHVTNVKSNVDLATIDYIIRDHDLNTFENRKQYMKKMVSYFNEKYGNRFTIEIEDQYYNMANYIKDTTCIEKAKKAIDKEGYQSRSTPVRGGTDGANLTKRGLPCPNLGTGSYNHHGRYEFASIQQMETMVRIVKNIICD